MLKILNILWATYFQARACAPTDGMGNIAHSRAALQTAMVLIIKMVVSILLYFDHQQKPLAMINSTWCQRTVWLGLIMICFKISKTPLVCKHLRPRDLHDADLQDGLGMPLWDWLVWTWLRYSARTEVRRQDWQWQRWDLMTKYFHGDVYSSL